MSPNSTPTQMSLSRRDFVDKAVGITVAGVLGISHPSESLAEQIKHSVDYSSGNGLRVLEAMSGECKLQIKADNYYL